MPTDVKGGCFFLNALLRNITFQASEGAGVGGTIKRCCHHDSRSSPPRPSATQHHSGGKGECCHRLLNLRNGIGNEWIWAYTPYYTGSQLFFCDN